MKTNEDVKINKVNGIELPHPLTGEQIVQLQEALRPTGTHSEPTLLGKLVGVLIGAALLSTLVGIALAWTHWVYALTWGLLQ